MTRLIIDIEDGMKGIVVTGPSGNDVTGTINLFEFRGPGVKISDSGTTELGPFGVTLVLEAHFESTPF